MADGWTGNDKANAALMMLDRIETVDPVDDDRIEGIKHIVHELATAPTGIPLILDGYVMVPVDLLSELRDWAHPEIEKYCEMWKGRRDSEFPALRKVIADADALLTAAPQEARGDINALIPLVSRNEQEVKGE